MNDQARATPELGAPPPQGVQGAVGIVGIGASAGGIQALEAFFQHLASSPAPGLAFVIVQHLDPERPSLMPELVARMTTLTVEHVHDHTAVEPDHVYLIQPNTTLTLDGDTLLAATPIAPRRTPIDSFFFSLAEQRGERAIGIVLSGGGSDGTLGLRAIREQGGMTMAQEPAIHDSMPRSAIAGGVVDYALPVEEMPAKLLEHVRQGFGESEPRGLFGRDGDVEGQLRRLAALIQRRTGHDFSRYKRATVLRRVQRRMQIVQAGSFEAYLGLLEGPEEAAQLFQSLLISVTQFFRDPEAFEVLARDVIPGLFQGRGANEEIRVWVAGCASGEEAYSMGILLLEEASRHDTRPVLRVFATDIDAAALETARLGRYPDVIADQVSPPRLSRFFVQQRDEYRIGKEVRDLCVFSSHNLISDPPFSRLDLLSCRNVFIYLEGDLQKRLVPLFHYALRPQGALLLGPSESLPAYPELFRLEDKKHRVYRRTDVLLSAGAALPLAEPFRALHEQRSLPFAPPAARDQSVLKGIERLLYEQYAPPSVVVNERGEIVHVFGRTGKYLELSPGTTARPNVVDMVSAALRPYLHTGLYRAVEKRETSVHADLAVELHGQVQRLNLVVRPLAQLAPGAGLVLVVFQELGALLSREQAEGEGVAPRAGHPFSEEVELELHRIKESLRTTVDELKISNEDLKSANEELLSMNEELQSSNEELQTSKEEMQSINEELQTVNLELHRKVEELNRAHSNLQNLFTSTQIATIFLDQRLCIKRFSPAAKAVLRVIESDVGRPITDLTAVVMDSELVADAREVLQTLEPRERQVHRAEGDLWYIRRIRPYRSLENTIEGVVVTLVDVSELKRAQARVTYLATIVSSSQEAILGLSLEGVISSWNAGATRIHGYTADEMVGRPYALLVPADRAAEMPHAYERLKRGELVEASDTARLRKDGKPLSVHLTLSSVVDTAGAIVGFSAIAHDITARMGAEEALKAADRHKNDFLAMLGHELRNPLAPIRNAAQMLRDSERGDPELAQARDIIDRQVQHMTRLIDDLLDLSRVSRGKILLRQEPTDLTELTRTALSDCQRLADAAGLTLEHSLPDRPLHVMGDPARLAQMLDNLLHNAVKFTEAGGRLTVHLDEVLDTGRPAAVALRVRDTGIGMDEETLSRLFEPFVQADRSLNRSRGGLGLGLALVKTLAELHGGAVTAQSQGLGHGSEVTLRLPRLVGPAPAASTAVAEAEAPSRRILVIEDNLDSALTLKLVLKRRGHDVVVAHTGAKGLEHALARVPEVVLCDIGLPGELDGYAVARALRADPRTAKVFLVALTGYGQEEDRRLTAEAGFDEHLVKPMAWSVLGTLLARLG